MWKKVDFGNPTLDSIKTSIDNLWKKISNHIISLQNLCAASMIISSRLSQPWITRECKRKLRRKKGSIIENYGPISLISLGGNVLKHIIHSNIISHIDQQIIMMNNYYNHS